MDLNTLLNSFGQLQQPDQVAFLQRMAAQTPSANLSGVPLEQARQMVIAGLQPFAGMIEPMTMDQIDAIIKATYGLNPVPAPTPTPVPPIAPVNPPITDGSTSDGSTPSAPTVN